ncbi:hypothetical protein TcBrA4_0090040 [Trypanosoma cruzi]|nr:hypothetical protein TcBrA4_0090040 [Trypanosoma cruzi]
MQSRYDLTGRDISTISTVGLVVGYFLMPYGFIFDHFGPKPIFILSMVLFPLGALLFALSFRGTIEGSVVRLSVFNAILTLGCTLYDVVYMMTIMSHFPNSKGPVVAILKSYIGLGSAIVGSIQLAFFDGRPDHYFYFLMVLFFVTGAAGFFLVPLPSYHLTGYEEKHLASRKRRDDWHANPFTFASNHPQFASRSALRLLSCWLYTCRCRAHWLRIWGGGGRSASYLRPS